MHRYGHHAVPIHLEVLFHTISFLQLSKILMHMEFDLNYVELNVNKRMVHTK